MHLDKPSLARYFADPQLQGYALLQKIFFAPTHRHEPIRGCGIDRPAEAAPGGSRPCVRTRGCPVLNWLRLASGSNRAGSGAAGPGRRRAWRKPRVTAAARMTVARPRLLAEPDVLVCIQPEHIPVLILHARVRNFGPGELAGSLRKWDNERLVQDDLRHFVKYRLQ